MKVGLLISDFHTFETEAQMIMDFDGQENENIGKNLIG